jgi:hypothetical protein
MMHEIGATEAYYSQKLFYEFTPSFPMHLANQLRTRKLIA